MADELQGWLSPEEIVFHRMRTFHCQRVEALSSAACPHVLLNDRLLIVHLIPEKSVQSRNRFSGSDLAKHAIEISPLGARMGLPRFNADGFIAVDGRPPMTAYSQLFRDGRLEAVMSDAAFDGGERMILQDSECERALFGIVPAYLKFCTAIGIAPPVWLFSAISGCEGAQISSTQRFRVVTEQVLDRPIAFLPEIEITTVNIEPTTFLRPWCDSLWQAAGVERSLNFDNKGNWFERR